MKSMAACNISGHPFWRLPVKLTLIVDAITSADSRMIIHCSYCRGSGLCWVDMQTSLLGRFPGAEHFLRALHFGEADTQI